MDRPDPALEQSAFEGAQQKSLALNLIAEKNFQDGAKLLAGLRQ